MCQSSEEGNVECMGIFRTKVKKFQNEVEQGDELSSFHFPLSTLKVPHMGWNQITDLRTPLFKDIDEGAYIYYVHSYYPELCADTIAATQYINAFSGALGRDNFFGTQFHPEKSGAVGAQILKNFLEL
jgi:glutamine amidotransferase